ncbi:MAG: GtrA family protein [Alphaproteobacteria bacterium]|nr:GtrA family protein [Alphaproteobacteria bacterium]
MKEIVKNHYKSFSRFSVVGLINTFIDFGVFVFLFYVAGFSGVAAHICAFFVALGNSFIFNALWTFKNLKRDQLIKQVSAFIIVGLIGLALTTPVVKYLSYWIHPLLAKVVAIFVSLIWNYIGSWIFVFKNKPKIKAQS